MGRHVNGHFTTPKIPEGLFRDFFWLKGTTAFPNFDCDIHYCLIVKGFMKAI